jgi:hypothetical protein
MEKRFYLGLAVLLLLFTLCVGAAIGMQAIHRPLEIALAEAADLAAAGEPEQAMSVAKEAYERWMRYHAVTASFADHNPMDDTDTLFQEMLVYAQTEEVPHFAACCRELVVLTQAMYDAHAFSLKNLL